jgi:hypothetical protein
MLEYPAVRNLQNLRVINSLFILTCHGGSRRRAPLLSRLAPSHSCHLRLGVCDHFGALLCCAELLLFVGSSRL